MKYGMKKKTLRPIFFSANKYSDYKKVNIQRKIIDIIEHGNKEIKQYKRNKEICTKHHEPITPSVPIQSQGRQSHLRRQKAAENLIDFGK